MIANEKDLILGSNVGTTIAGVTSSWGGARSLLYYPHAIDVTESGTMFILDTYNYRVLRWQAGEPLGFLVAGGNGNGGGFNQIGLSYALFVDQQLNVFISDNAYHRVTRWSSSNTTSGVLVILFKNLFSYSIDCLFLLLQRLLVETVLEQVLIN